VDENIKTYWSAASSNENEWIQSDLGAISTVYAIQINYCPRADIVCLSAAFDVGPLFNYYGSGFQGLSGVSCICFANP
jgi:hypothetical protein